MFRPRLKSLHAFWYTVSTFIFKVMKIQHFSFSLTFYISNSNSVASGDYLNDVVTARAWMLYGY